MKNQFLRAIIVALLMITMFHQISAFTLVIKADAKVKNLILFPHLSTFSVDLVAGANEIQFDSYPNAGYLMLKSPLKSSGKWRYLPMIWVASDTSRIEITVDADYNIIFTQNSEYQDELTKIFESSNRFSLFPYEPSADRPLEPILVLEAKSIIQNSKSYTDHTVLENLLKLSKLRNIDNASTGVIAAYLKEPFDKIYAKGKLLKIFGLDSRENSVNVELASSKMMLLHVSGSWCGPCVKGLPNLRKTYDEVNPQIEFVSLWNDPRLSVFKNLHREKKQQIIWTNLWDKYGLMANALHVNEYPTYILFDQKGMEVKRWEGKLPANLKDEIPK